MEILKFTIQRGLPSPVARPLQSFTTLRNNILKISLTQATLQKSLCLIRLAQLKGAFPPH